MTKSPLARPGEIVLVSLAVVVMGVLGCNRLEDPVWNNPLDPTSSSYFMPFPVMGSLVAGSGRQVTIPVYSVDPYASRILVERRNGSTGDFVQIGSAPASQQSYVDVVPLSEGPTVWYRVRLQAVGGALSPYSTSAYVTIP